MLRSEKRSDMSHHRKSKRITLADVAREAGVSVQTASHALSGSNTARIADSTKAKVQEAAKRIQYKPNVIAQAMRTGRTNVVSVWMPLDRPILTYLRYLHLFQEICDREDYQIMVTGLNTKSALTQEGGLPKIWPVDGIISVDAGKAIENLRADPTYDNIPIVILGYEDVPRADRVAWDVIGAVKVSIQELIKGGCKRIVHIAPKWLLDDFPNERRRRGYTEAMQEAGLTLEFVPVPEDTSSSVEDAVFKYFSAHGIPDAVFGITDAVAIGAARALMSLDKRIPEDCRVQGFGNYPESADFKVAISTISPPQERIVSQAWQWLRERIRDQAIPPRYVEFEMELVRRESTSI